MEEDTYKIGDTWYSKNGQVIAREIAREKIEDALDASTQPEGRTGKGCNGGQKNKKNKDKIDLFTQSTLTKEEEAAVTFAFATKPTTDPSILRVPEDYTTLVGALKVAKEDPHVTIIFVGEGKHRAKKDLKGNHHFLIDFPINIIGSGDKNLVLLLGGICLRENIQGNVHLQNVTIRHYQSVEFSPIVKGFGVYGRSPFTMEDVIVERCGQCGVWASGMCVATLINVEIRQCIESGLYASSGGSIVLSGERTRVHHNNTSGKSRHFGLLVRDATSNIYFQHPLTKEIVATNNPRQERDADNRLIAGQVNLNGGNWGTVGKLAE